MEKNYKTKISQLFDFWQITTKNNKPQEPKDVQNGGQDIDEKREIEI